MNTSEEAIGTSAELQSVGYAAVLLTNIEAAEMPLRELYHQKLKNDPIRAAHLMKTLANMAGVTADGDRKHRIHEFFVGIAFDRSRPTQERLLALDYLRASITLDEAMRLKRQLGEESDGPRRLLNNWLWEFFGPES
jgi:hypothetical protein